MQRQKKDWKKEIILSKMRLSNTLDQWIANISQTDMFLIMRNTYVSLTIWIAGISLVYIVSSLCNVLFLKECILYVLSYHSILFSAVFACAYARQKQMDVLLCLIVGCVCSVLMTGRFSATLWMSIPDMVIISGLLKIVQILEKQKAEWKHIPPAVSQYLVKLLVPVTVFVMLGLLTLIPDTVMTAMTVPLQVLVYALSTLPSILIIIGLTCYFWIKGIHGVSILGTILRPFWTQMLLMNLYAVLTQNEIMYIGSEAFYQWFVWIGGSGATFGLCIVCYLFGKSKQMQALKANALSSAVFNINEEVIFGMPMVENRYLKIPFFAVSMISGCVAWVLMRTGYIPVPHVLAPWIAPFFIGSMLTSGISLRVLIVSVGLVLFSALCYLPFFLWYDARLLKDEK